MGRPRVTKGLPPYVTEFRDRHGKMRLRFRRTGFPSKYMQHPVGSDDFWKEYLALKNGEKLTVGADRLEPGTFNDLIAQYYRSTTWANIPKESTKRVYRGTYERFRAQYGDRPVATMSAKNVARLMEKMHETPTAGAILLKRLRQLFDYAILMGMRKDNPAKAVKPPKSKGTGFHTWEEEEIDAFVARHPVGTKAHLALCLLLYTAQRRSDVVTMGPQHVKNGRIRVKQMKTGKELFIPIHPRLASAIAACPSGQLAYLVTEFGKPFTANGFGNWFRKRCDEAGLEKCAAHGLRKAASRRMAEVGMSNQSIKSITGHTTDSEISRYTRDADQVLLADQTMAAMIRADLSTQETGLDKSASKTPENKG
ncbi:MAG: tyrosine-type recombinase/integrase [Sphingobium sp.]|nr:tyrosine-type recombinase/integrase [Sphingobium sp.]